MNIVETTIPQRILEDSTLAWIAAAYFSVGRKLERKTQCSATRGFILSVLRDRAMLNPNQIATLLGLDRTVVHRAVKSMVREGLVVEQKKTSARAIPVALTRKGEEYRAFLIKQRKAADEKLSHALTRSERAALIRLLKIVAEVEF